MEDQTLVEIRDELRELRILYSRLVNHFIPVEDPEPGDIEAINAPDEYVDLDEVKAILKKPARKR